MALKRPQVEISESVDGEWFWHLQARNGEIIAAGAETYTRREDAVRAYKTARKTFLVAKRLK